MSATAVDGFVTLGFLLCDDMPMTRGIPNRGLVPMGRRAFVAARVPLRAACCFAAFLWLQGAGATAVCGDVIVIANPTGSQQHFTVYPNTGEEKTYLLPAGDTLPIDTNGRARIRFSSRGETTEHRLDANSIYFFRQEGERLLLHTIDLRGDESTLAGRDLGQGVEPTRVALVPVKILVDEEEPATQTVWEKRLRARVAAASNVFERACRVRFQVLTTGEWESNNQLKELGELLAEFEQEVAPSPAILAIGFSAQRLELRERTHLGGTRALLRSHILLNEWMGGVSEAEKLELLVHELGHYLGAAHSPEPNSVMRPILADGQARLRELPIHFDVINLLIINLVGEELRHWQEQNLPELSAGTRVRLRQIYAILAESMPEDQAARVLQKRVDTEQRNPLAAATRRVVLTVSRSAQGRVPTTERNQKRETQLPPPNSDKLTEFYVREAAMTAAELPQEVAGKAFLLGLGMALEDSDILLRTPLVREFCESVETSPERTSRVRRLDSPTMLGRRDLAQHFFISAFLAAYSNALIADAAGLAKELQDATSGSGFSFVDLAADQAGIAFAQYVLAGKSNWTNLANTFRVDQYLPGIDSLPEGLSHASFQDQYGGPSDQRFQEVLRAIQARVRALPPYHALQTRGSEAQSQK